MTNDKQRERLVELLEDVIGEGWRTMCEAIADNLLIEGGIIVPPCKVGDVLYYVSKNPINISVLPNTIYEAEIVRIVTTNLGTTLVVQIRNEYGVTEIPDVNDWGKTVFLTKEEAEEALEGGEENG